MMDQITIELDRKDGSYVPGERITGRVSWDLGTGPASMTVRLLWQTSGKGTQDVGVASEENWDMLSARESRAFAFEGIDGPYSFSGKLITIGWLIEVVAEPGGEHAEQILTLSPTGQEVRA